jgi:8-oxo-dGTP diphosphatase
VTWPRVGVGCIVRRDAEVLLLRRHGSHGSETWASPGGELDFGEDPAVCAARETEEETGLRVSGLRFIGVTNDVFEVDAKHYVSLWYETDTHDGEATLLSPGEHAELRWFPADALPDRLFPPLRRLLEGEVLR